MSEEQPTKKQMKADAAAEKARGKAERPLWKKKRVIIPVALLALIVLVSVTSGGDDDTGTDEPVGEAETDEADETATDEDATDQDAGAEDEDVPDDVPDDAEFAGIGEEARDGDFAFTVTSLEQLGSTLPSGNQFMDDLETSGVFYQLTVNVENIGDSAQSLSSSNQYLYDADERRFSAVSSFDLIGLDIYDESPTFEQLNPGAFLEGGVVIFDVPEGVEIEFAGLHDSAFSGGVLVDLR